MIKIMKNDRVKGETQGFPGEPVKEYDAPVCRSIAFCQESTILFSSSQSELEQYNELNYVW